APGGQAGGEGAGGSYAAPGGTAGGLRPGGPQKGARGAGGGTGHGALGLPYPSVHVFKPSQCKKNDREELDGPGWDPHEGAGQGPAAPGGGGRDEDDEGLEHDPAHDTEPTAGPDPTQAAARRRREAEEHDQARPAVDEQRGRRHQQDKVLGHVDGEQGSRQG